MDNLVYESLNRYFTHLGNVGYTKQAEIYKLLFLITLQELLDGDFKELISEKDYEEINKALYCVYGSTCLAPYPDYYSKGTKVKTGLSD